MNSARPRLFHSPTLLATALASVAAAAEALTGHPDRSATVVIACASAATAVTALALYSFDQERLAAVRTLALLGLAIGFIFLQASDTDGFFVLFPTISVLYVASSLAVTAAAILALALVIVLLGLHGGVPVGVVEGHALGFTGGAAFVAAFVRIALAEQRARSEAQRMTAVLQELATAEERNRIAREIHDGVGHALTAVHVHLETARALAAGSPGGESLLPPIDRAKEGAREALDEVRRAVSVLRGSMVDRSLVEGVLALAQESESAGVSVDVQVEGTPRRLPPAVEFALFRVAQEGLTNVRRHASAKSATVTLEFESDSAEVRVSDDGAGAPSSLGSGFGLVGIRERAALLGGSVEVRTSPGQGFELSVRVPV